MFKKIIYNDKETNYDEFDITPYDKCFVKIYISNKTDTDMYERLMDRFYNHINIHAIRCYRRPYRYWCFSKRRYIRTRRRYSYIFR